MRTFATARHVVSASPERSLALLHMRRATRVAAISTLCLLGSAHAASNDASATAASGTSGPTYRIEIHDFAFSPKVITVPVGTRIVWINRDEEPHTVVSAAGAFKPSQALDTDDSFSAVLDKPGTYAYFCGIHPMMVGKIVVR